MKFFLDTEFMEDGKVILPISIAAVTETGDGFYGVMTDADYTQANEFVVREVLPYVDGNPMKYMEGNGTLYEYRGPTKEVGQEFLSWVDSYQSRSSTELEFWANYAAYDWIVVCQMYGAMVDLPEGWPMFCRDIQQERENPRQWLPRPRYAHHPLSDAFCVKDRLEYLQDLKRWED